MRRLRTLKGVAACVVVVTSLGAIASIGGAADAPDTSIAQVRTVDSVDPAAASVTFFSSASAAEATAAKITINDKDVPGVKVTPLPGARSIGNALVFDTSTSMDKPGALVAAKDAAKKWIQSRTGDRALSERFAIYAASDTATLVQDFTTDTGRLVAAIDRVAPSPVEKARSQSALWAAVRLAAGGLAAQSDLQPNLVILAGQNDTASGPSKAAALGEIASARAAVFSLAFTSSGFDGAQLKSLTAIYGGRYQGIGEGPKMGTLVDATATTIDTQQYVATFDSGLPRGQVVNMTIDVGGQSAKAAFNSGSTTTGWVNLNPASKTTAHQGVSFLQGGLGLAVAVLLVLIAVGLGVYVFALLVTRDSALDSALMPYSEGFGNQSDDDDDDTSLARTAIIQRAVEVTEQFAQQQGFLVRAEGALERANLPLRAGEALFFYSVVVVLATLLGLALGGLILCLMFGVAAALIPTAAVSFMAGRRRKKFLSTLPDTLSLLSGTLRAGYSLMQGVEAVSQEVEEPMGAELRRVVTESRLGRPLEESLEGVAERMNSADFGWAVMAIRIQREVGGNLSELLLTVAETMTHRERLRREVSALTAEGRISAIILGLLPIGLGGAMFAINPAYSSKLIDDTLGNIMLGASVVAMIVGFVWMKKIIDIEI